MGKDSIYKDGDTRYVYVKNDEGGREKRIITTGEYDENYTQVTEGLKEGELVYYNSTDQVPTRYSKYTVTRSDFDIANYGVSYSRSDAGTITETCDYEGQIVSVNVKQDDTVENGMLLYVVDTGEGKAAITEAKNEIDAENESYAHKIADYDKQVKDLSEGGSSAEENNQEDEKPDTAYEEQQLKLNLQLLDLQKKLAGADHTYQLSRLQSAYDSISAGNDGKGNISVYAKNDGKVSKVSVKAGDNVEEGSDILQITGNSTDVLQVLVRDSNNYNVYTDNIADVGERVSLELDGTTIYGNCIGFAGYGRQAQRGYINQDDKGVHITGNTDSGYGNASFKSDSGELFFGGINGLNTFYPQDINKMDSGTKVLFDGFSIDNKEYNDIEGMKFKSSTDDINIKFFTPIYSSNKNLMYEYKLIGASGEVFTTKNNYVTFSELPPGKYTFEVRVIDTGGNKSEASSVSFKIKPPFWRSPIAILAYIIAAILFVLKYKYEVKKLDRLVKERTKDLVEEMKKNTILHNKNIKLERNKNSYFVNLSHELRTPLNVMSSTNQLLKGLSGNSIIDGEKLNYYVDISQRNCKRLLNLINNILDSSKLQNDMYQITLKETDVVYLVEETALTLKDYIYSKGIDLIIDPQIEEKMIKCDPYEIERCIINLVGNAVKFTPEGGSITIDIEDLDDKVKISVTDTGCGIDEKFHKAIFDRFSQVEDSEPVKSGSGLGLTITNQIIKLHKGKIYVESELGKGSTFVIILPVNPEI